MLNLDLVEAPHQLRLMDKAIALMAIPALIHQLHQALQVDRLVADLAAVRLLVAD